MFNVDLKVAGRYIFGMLANTRQHIYHDQVQEQLMDSVHDRWMREALAMVSVEASFQMKFEFLCQ